MAKINQLAKSMRANDEDGTELELNMQPSSAAHSSAIEPYALMNSLNVQREF